MENLAIGALWFLVFLFSVVVHEAAHAFAALKLGDRTAYEGGQVTLDPIPHIRREPFGTIAVPILSFLSAGWMIGWASTPYDRDWARRHPDRSALMALAGPLANLLLVIAAALLIRLGMALDFFHLPSRIGFSHVVAAYQDGTPAGIAALLSILFTLNLILFVFNLLPLLLSREKAVAYLSFIENTPFILIGLLVAWKLFDHVFAPVHLAFLNLLYPGAGFH